MTSPRPVLAAVALFLLAATPPRADVLNDVFGALAGTVRDIRATSCPASPGPGLSEALCGALTAAEDLLREGAAPSPCGDALMRPCDQVFDLGRRTELGGPCAAGLTHLEPLLCLDPQGSGALAGREDELVRLGVDLGLAYLDFRNGNPALTLRLAEAIGRSDAEEVERILRNSHYFDEVMALLHALGLHTMTISVSGAGGFGVGAGGEGGVAIPTDPETYVRVLPAGFVARPASAGAQFGGGVDVVIGGWIPEPGNIGGKATGRSLQIDVATGTGGAIWYGPDGRFTGVTAAPGVAGFGGGVSFVVVNTSVWTIDRAAPGPGPSPTPGDAPAPAAPTARITVAPGDTLWRLAEVHLGDPMRHPEIFGLNRPPLRDPDLILPGTVLALPDR